MTLPTAETPLYNHPLPEIENWLKNLGSEQDPKNLHCWYLKKEKWEAEINLEIEEIRIVYLKAGEGGKDIIRAFKYSLSRSDIEAAILAGP